MEPRHGGAAPTYLSREINHPTARRMKWPPAREVIAFFDHWKSVSGADPHLLVMDQQVTTRPVLGELDARGVRFLALRMRSPSLLPRSH